MTGVTITANPEKQQMLDGTVEVTANGIGGTAPYEYKFMVRKSSETEYIVGQNYSSQDSWVWNTAGYQAGSYILKVCARSAGSIASCEAANWYGYQLAD